MNGEVDSRKKFLCEEDWFNSCVSNNLTVGRSKDFVTLWRQVKISLEK